MCTNPNLTVQVTEQLTLTQPALRKRSRVTATGIVLEQNHFKKLQHTLQAAVAAPHQLNDDL